MSLGNIPGLVMYGTNGQSRIYELKGGCMSDIENISFLQKLVTSPVVLGQDYRGACKRSMWVPMAAGLQSRVWKYFMLIGGKQHPTTASSTVFKSKKKPLISGKDW